MPTPAIGAIWPQTVAVCDSTGIDSGFGARYHRALAVADHARPDLEAHAHATRASFNDVAAELRELLGAKLVAYLGGVGETRAAHQWADGERAPNDEIQQRLRFALRVALPVARADSPAIAQAWFQGLNPQLDDRSPARLLRDGDLDEVGPAIVAAERAFLIGG
jgi:hypothetical protein